MRSRLDPPPLRPARALALALLLSACHDEDDDDDGRLDAGLAQQVGDPRSGDGGEPLPPVSAASLPDCAPYLRQQRFVFGYPLPAQLTAAAATREGYVVLAFEGLDIPILKLAHSPEGRVDENLHTLLPESARAVVALSEIRDGRILVVHGPSADRVPAITAVDLRTRAVVWSRPLRDPSGLPRPRFGAAGNVIDEQRGADVPGALVHRITLRADGRYDVLANLESSLYLLGFAPDGSATYRTLIHPEPVISVPSMVTLSDRTMAIVIDVESTRRTAFEAVHRYTITQRGRVSAVPVLLQLDENGSVWRIREPTITAGGGLTGNLTAPQDRPTWFTSDWGLSRQMIASIGPHEAEPHTAATPLRFHDDGLRAMAVVGENLYVTGLLDQQWGFKAQLRGGTPFLSRVTRDGSLRWGCVDRRPPESWQPPIEDMTLHDTQAPLLSVRAVTASLAAMQNDPALANRLRVYFVQEPSE